MNETCTRSHRMQDIACYVFMPDGGVWTVYSPCEHGVAETTPVWIPRLSELVEMQNATDQMASAQSAT